MADSSDHGSGKAARRARRLGQFDLRRVQQPKAAQEGLLRSAPMACMHARGPDIRGFDHHLVTDISGRNRENPSILKRPHFSGPRVSMMVSGVTSPCVQRLCHGKGLHHRPQFVIALHRAVEQRAVAGFAFGGRRGTVIGVEIGQGHKAQHLAGLRIHQHGAGPARAQHRHAA